MNRLSFGFLLAILAAGTASAASAPNDPHYRAEGSWGQDFADQWALRAQRIYADIAPNDAGE